MAGGKGKSHGGKAGPKAGEGGRTQISHSAKAGLQVSSKSSLRGHLLLRIFIAVWIWVIFFNAVFVMMRFPSRVEKLWQAIKSLLRPTTSFR